MEKTIKLTSTQEAEIKNYLTCKGLKYIDIRFEILDHIVTDIEFLIKTKNISFESAFDSVTSKWNKSLKNKSSFWIGLAYFRPSLLIEKSVKMYKAFLYKSILLIIVTIGFVISLKEFFVFSFSDYKEGLSSAISVGMTLYIVFGIYWYYRIKNGKLNSTYGFLYKKQLFMFLFLAILYHPLIYNRFFTSENELDYAMLVLLLLFLTSAIGGRYLYKKHIETLSKNKICL